MCQISKAAPQKEPIWFSRLDRRGGDVWWSCLFTVAYGNSILCWCAGIYSCCSPGIALLTALTSPVTPTSPFP